MSNTNEKTIFNRIAKYSTSEILSHFQQDDANVTLKKLESTDLFIMRIPNIGSQFLC